MRFLLQTGIGILILGIGLVVLLFFPESSSENGESFMQDAMELSSPAFGANGKIPVSYTCDGENVNPALRISGVPQGTHTLALIMEDPDAPGGTFVHWTLWNIDPSTEEIPENSVPAGAVQGMTSFGRTGYGGPCPPSGTHRYVFKLFALNTALSLTPQADASQLEAAMEGSVLGTAELIGLYSRE